MYSGLGNRGNGPPFEQTQPTSSRDPWIYCSWKILALEPLNGWAISQRLKQVSGDVLQVSDGSLIPRCISSNRLPAGSRRRVEAQRE